MSKPDIFKWLKEHDFGHGFFTKFKKQLEQNKKASQTLAKFINGQKCSKEELEEIKTLATDTLKMAGMSSLFILPGGSILIWALINGAKKYDISLLPSQFESVDTEKIWSGKQVWKWIVEITPNKEDIPHGFKSLIINRKFKIEKINPLDLLQSDPDFKEFFDSAYDRYSDQTPDDDDWQDPNNIKNEPVIVDGIVLDGYNRLANRIRQEDKSIYCYIAI